MSLKNDVRDVKLEVSQKTNQISQKVDDVENKVDTVKNTVSQVQQEMQQGFTDLQQELNSIKQIVTNQGQELTAVKQVADVIEDQTKPERLLPHQKVVKWIKDISLDFIDSFTGSFANRVKWILGIIMLIVICFFAWTAFGMDYFNNAKSITEKPETPIVQQVPEQKEDKPSTTTVVPEDVQKSLDIISEYTKKTAEENASLKQENESLTTENKSLKEENEVLKKQIEESKQQKIDIQK